MPVSLSILVELHPLAVKHICMCLVLLIELNVT